MRSPLASVPTILIGLAFASVTASAVDYTWQGGAGNNILEPANWVGGVVPPNDGQNINLRATDRLLFVENAPFVPNEADRQINMAAGAQIVVNNPGDKSIDARVNMQGTGPDSNGAMFISPGGWGKPQNLALTGATTITVNGSRFRMDGGPNRLDLAGNTLIFRGSGETNFVNTDITNTSGTIIARNLFSVEGQTRIDPNVTIDLAPGVLYTSWDGGNARRDSAVILRDGAVLETRLRDANLTFAGPITVNAGDIGILRGQIQNNGAEAGNGTDMRLNVMGPIGGGGRVQHDGNGTVILSGNNTFTGGTTLVGNAGSVVAASNAAFGTGSVLVSNAATVHLSNTGGLESRDTLGREADLTPSTVINPVLTALQATQPFPETRFNYTGKINNPTAANVVYTFIEQYDDEVYLTVDGNVVINDGSWNTPASGQVSLTPGEHDIRISVRNGGGGAGPNNGENDAFPGFNVADPSMDIGVGYSTSVPLGVVSTNPIDYKPLGLGFEVYQPTDRTIANSFSLNNPLTLTTTHMHGFKATMSGAFSGESGLFVQGSPEFATDQLILSGTNTYSGNTAVQPGGNLRLTGSHTNAVGFSVEAGSVLNLDGTLVVTDAATPTAPADLLITNDGTAAFGSTSVLRLDIFADLPGATGAAGENDELLTSGSIALTLGGTLTVGNPNNITSFSFGDSWDLFDWGRAPLGTFSAVNLPALGSGLRWDTADIYSGGTVGVVPEPSAIGLLGMAAGAALLARRRRRTS